MKLILRDLPGGNLELFVELKLIDKGKEQTFCRAGEFCRLHNESFTEAKLLALEGLAYPLVKEMIKTIIKQIRETKSLFESKYDPNKGMVLKVHELSNDWRLE